MHAIPESLKQHAKSKTRSNFLTIINLKNLHMAELSVIHTRIADKELTFEALVDIDLSIL